MVAPSISIPGDRLVLASHNAGKIREIRELLAPYGYALSSAADLALAEPEETGTAFEENAALKAVAARDATGLPALSDDSGLCIDALDGAPGVYTADWAEMPDGTRDFGKAMQMAEDRLVAAGARDPAARTGRFVAVLCLATPGHEPVFFRGEVEGTLVWPPRGERGFGYDPVFQPEGHDRTFGEMTPDEKHGTGTREGLSHRARAFAAFRSACLERQ